MTVEREPDVLCPQCGHHPRPGHATCPECDHPRRKTRLPKVTLLLIGIALVALNGCSSDNTNPLTAGTASLDQVNAAIDTYDPQTIAHVHSDTTLNIEGNLPSANPNGVDPAHLAISIDGTSSLDATAADITITSNLPASVSPPIRVILLEGTQWTRVGDQAWTRQDNVGDAIGQLRRQSRTAITNPSDLRYAGPGNAGGTSTAKYEATINITDDVLADLDGIGQGLLPTTSDTLTPLIGSPLTISYEFNQTGQFVRTTITLDLLPVLVNSDTGRQSLSGATSAQLTQTTTWTDIGAPSAPSPPAQEDTP